MGLSACVTTKIAPEMEKETGCIYFSGYEWEVKNSYVKGGPGGNFFGLYNNNIKVDDLGRLHLSLQKADKSWVCAEIMSYEPFGYGRYTFQLIGRIDQFDRNMVLGMFLYDNDKAPHYNEIDIEFSQWGFNDYPNTQYVVHTGAKRFLRERFQSMLSGTHTTHSILWAPDSIVFESYHGHYDPELQSREPYQRWVYRGRHNPSPENSKVHLNLWLRDGRSPSSKSTKEIIISNFIFQPLEETRPYLTRQGVLKEVIPAGIKE